MSQFSSVTVKGIQHLTWDRFAAMIIIAASLIAIDGILFAQSKSDKPSGERTDASGRKYVNKIPYDVFFDNPLQLVNVSKNIVTQPETPGLQLSEPDAPPASTKAPAKSHETQWNLLLPMEELQNEVKAVRNSLAKSLANQGQFRQNLKTIAISGTELAALAAIVQDYDEPLSWKDKSPYVREFGAQISAAATGLSKDDFEKTKSAFQRLSTALDGSIPADAGDVPEVRPFSEAASRKGLMKRIEKAKDWLKQDINSEAKFKSMSDQIVHETAILSALATVITKSGYEYTDNDDYQSYAKMLIEGAKEASDASGEAAYGKFKQAVDKVNKSCTDCHGTYGNG